MEDANALQAMNLHGKALGRPANTPALNAAQHGLTAKKFLPDILGAELVQEARRQFWAEWQPATATEQHLVAELARHAAALARAEQIEEGLLRTSARGLSLTSCAAEDSELRDRILAASVGAEALDRLTRHRRAHERAFLATLERLHQLRGERPQPAVLTEPAQRLHVHFDEKSCRAFLRRRWETGACSCPACAGTAGTWLGSRDLWQCRTCRNQSGLRSSTVMARSSLPLPVWFAAISAVCRDPEIPLDALCEITGIARRKTVCALAERIRRALKSDDSDRLLAGLTRDGREQPGGSGR
jgi:hypothetical protein